MRQGMQLFMAAITDDIFLMLFERRSQALQHVRRDQPFGYREQHVVFLVDVRRKMRRIILCGLGKALRIDGRGGGYLHGGDEFASTCVLR